MQQLEKYNFIEIIKGLANQGNPILGICLDMQILATKSFEYGETNGLNLIKGEVKSLPKDLSLRIPNVGWRQLCIGSQESLKNLKLNGMMYFVHSYVFYPKNFKDTLATIKFSTHSVPVIIRNKNVIGCQFHPEKSGNNGLNFLRWFCKYV